MEGKQNYQSNSMYNSIMGKYDSAKGTIKNVVLGGLAALVLAASSGCTDIKETAFGKNYMKNVVSTADSIRYANGREVKIGYNIRNAKSASDILTEKYGIKFDDSMKKKSSTLALNPEE